MVRFGSNCVGTEGTGAPGRNMFTWISRNSAEVRPREREAKVQKSALIVQKVRLKWKKVQLKCKKCT